MSLSTVSPVFEHHPQTTPFEGRPQGLLTMADLFEWESRELSVLNTISGRTVYYAVAKRYFSDPSVRHYPLKSLAICQSDRAIRNRIDDFVAQGLLTLRPNPHDARVRDLAPTAKLIDLFNRHSHMMRSLFGQRFHFIVKDQ